jgi:hypothetical protein
MNVTNDRVEAEVQSNMDNLIHRIRQANDRVGELAERIEAHGQRLYAHPSPQQAGLSSSLNDAPVPSAAYYQLQVGIDKLFELIERAETAFSNTVIV